MKETVWDVLAVAGGLTALVGLWWLSPAFSLIVGGLAAVLAALVGAYRCRCR